MDRTKTILVVTTSRTWRRGSSRSSGTRFRGWEELLALCSSATVFEELAYVAANHNVDWWLPTSTCADETGRTLLQTLQEKRKRCRTIIVAAYGDMINIRTAYEPRRLDFLTSRSILSTRKRRIAKTIRHSDPAGCAARQAAAEAGQT